MSGNVKIITVNVGAVSNETLPLFKVPTAAMGGGISILEASMVQGGSTNSSLRLVTIANPGTALPSGTITTTALGGTASPFAANKPKSFAIATAYVDANKWVGIKEGNVAACNSQAILSIKYVDGK